ncbi:replication factor C large subunit [[Eubacterium] cellulosolvens]
MPQLPWTIKHRPTNSSEVVGNREAIETLKNWILSWKRDGTSKKATLLHGPPGIGKTVLVETLAKELNFDLVEMNASDLRSGKVIDNVIGSAVEQQDLFQRKKIILIDEVDSISPKKDRGAVQSILKLIESTNYPMVMTANDVWDPKVRGLRDKSLLIQFKRISSREAFPFLKKLLDEESVEVDDDTLKSIIQRNEGDIRSMINDLQMIAAGKNRIIKDDITWLAWRDRKEPIFDALKLVFTSKDCFTARRALDISEVDYEMLFEWIYENVPRQLSDSSDMVNAMEALSKADLFIARTKKHQAWSLLSYVIDLMTAGVAMAREKTKPAWIPMKFPQRISLMSRTMRERALMRGLGNKIGSKCHLSSKSSVRDFVPYLRIIMKNDTASASSLEKWLELDEEMINYLKG